MRLLHSRTNLLGGGSVIGGAARRCQHRYQGLSKSGLAGKSPDPSLFEAAGNEAVVGAKTYAGNRFKVEMARRAVSRAPANAAGGAA